MSSTIIRYRFTNQIYDPWIVPKTATIPDNWATLGDSLNAGGPTSEPWYHLQADSPAIDAGASGLVSEDIEGTARPLGSGTDIGAVEEK